MVSKPIYDIMLHFYHLVNTKPAVLPFIRGVELHRDHVQGVPRGDADAPEQAQEGNHPRFAVSKHQEEAADAGYDTGSRWRGRRGATLQRMSNYCK